MDKENASSIRPMNQIIPLDKKIQILEKKPIFKLFFYAKKVANDKLKSRDQGFVMGIREIRKASLFEEIDNDLIMNYLYEYKRPYDKISSLIKAGDLINIKKGLYVFGENHSKGPYSREILANLIYGPSYISLEFALYHYGLIPERAEEVTCMTLKKRYKHFDTPIGRFSYRYLKASVYFLALTLEKLADGRHFIIATKEKALADLVVKEKSIMTLSDLNSFIFENLRIYEEDFTKFDLKLLQEIKEGYNKHSINLLYELRRTMHA